MVIDDHVPPSAFITPAVHEIFLKDTKAVCTKMLVAQEVNFLRRL